MVEIKVMLDKGAKMPTKAHKSDAGYDIYAPDAFGVAPKCSWTIDTGVHMVIPDGYVGFLKSKSGLNVKHGLTGEGVVDAGYTGSIKVKMYNDSNSPYIFEKGDKVIQIVILPIPETKLVHVDSLEETDRGNNGFGSSGR
ncbi:MAG: dUTP diphosphatase [Lachnospiraceae bacterium]|nr:dUTP diphosphatase [Lachnospiraceae bacterium]